MEHFDLDFRLLYLKSIQAPLILGHKALVWHMKETLKNLQVEFLWTPETYGSYGVLYIRGPPPTSATLYVCPPTSRITHVQRQATTGQRKALYFLSFFHQFRF